MDNCNMICHIICFSVDFEAERNYIHEHVYPLVRQYCRETHGVDFQVSEEYSHIFINIKPYFII